MSNTKMIFGASEPFHRKRLNVNADGDHVMRFSALVTKKFMVVHLLIFMKQLESFVPFKYADNRQ